MTPMARMECSCLHVALMTRYHDGSHWACTACGSMFIRKPSDLPQATKVEKEEDKVICAECDHCKQPGDDVNWVCDFEKPKDVINYITGEIEEQKRYCSSKNILGTCQDFVPSGTGRRMLELD